MIWKDDGTGDEWRARCGELFVRIVKVDLTRYDASEPIRYEWFIEPDDADKSYRRAWACSQSPHHPTFEAAKETVSQRLAEILNTMLRSLLFQGTEIT